MDDRFLKIVDNLLITEGGYVDDPKDAGGETRFGISKRSYPALDIKNLTRDEAVNIYYTDFWTMYSYGKIRNDSLAEKVFSLSVNMGPFKAHLLLQVALNFTGRQVLIDGYLGAVTLKAVNDHPSPGWLLATYKIEAVKHYLKLDKPRFDRGWILRAVA
jgi:lysozyme family protein